MLVIILIVSIVWAVGFTWGGATMCSKNNAAGLILCFLGTALLGLVIGWVCLSKARETESNKKEQINREIWKAQDIKRDEANKEDKEIIKDLLKQNQELLEALKKKETKDKNENQENKL